MTSTSLVDRYLAEVRAATRTLPKAQQGSIVSDIESHIEQALSPNANEAEIRTVLDRLGSPQSIAAEAGAVPDGGKSSPVKEVIALLGISVGSLILPGVGWLVGVVLLWMSTVWTLRQKLAGTLVWPFGWIFPAVFPLLVVRASTDPSSQPLVQSLVLLVGVGAPLVVLVWLIRSLVRARAS